MGTSPPARPSDVQARSEVWHKENPCRTPSIRLQFLNALLNVPFWVVTSPAGDGADGDAVTGAMFTPVKS